MKKFLLIVLPWLCLMLCSYVQISLAQTDVDRAFSTEPDVKKSPGRIFLFLVAVEEYEQSEYFSTLNYTVADLKGWQKQWESIGVDPGNIIVLASREGLSRSPQKQRIIAELNRLLTRVGADDMIIVMFSGHGTQIEKGQFFCPEDANAENLPESCVSLNDVLSDLEKSQAKFKWLIVDACRNDPTKSFGSVKSLGKMESVPQGVTAFFSCAETERSYEAAELGHGVFTHYLIEGLKGEAADKRGAVTIMGLYKYVIGETKNFVKDHYKNRQGGPASQVPHWLWGDREITDFVLRDGVIVGTAENTSADTITEGEKPRPTKRQGQPINYTLDLSKVALGNLPLDWEGSNNAVVNTINSSKCLTNNSDRQSAEVAINNIFYQPGDFILSVTIVRNKGRSLSMHGNLTDENGSTLPFAINSGIWSSSFGDSPSKIYTTGKSTDNSANFIFARRGDVVSFTRAGFENEVITMRSQHFQSLTGFQLTIPRTNNGISQLSVRSLSDAEQANDEGTRSVSHPQATDPEEKTRIRIRGVNAIEVLSSGKDGKSLGRLETMTASPDFNDKYTIVP